MRLDEWSATLAAPGNLDADHPLARAVRFGSHSLPGVEIGYGEVLYNAPEDVERIAGELKELPPWAPFRATDWGVFEPDDWITDGAGGYPADGEGVLRRAAELLELLEGFYLGRGGRPRRRHRRGGLAASERRLLAVLDEQGVVVAMGREPQQRVHRHRGERRCRRRGRTGSATAHRSVTESSSPHRTTVTSTPARSTKRPVKRSRAAPLSTGSDAGSVTWSGQSSSQPRAANTSRTRASPASPFVITAAPSRPRRGRGHGT